MVEAFQYIAVGSKAEYPKGNDEDATVPALSLYKGPNAGLGGHPLIFPILAEGLHPYRSIAFQSGHPTNQRFQLRNPALIPSIVPFTMGQDKD